MKNIRFYACLAIYLCVLSCDVLSYLGLEPVVGPPDGVRCVSAIEYTYIDNLKYRRDFSHHYTLKFAYDDNWRIASVREVCEGLESFQTLYTLDYPAKDRIKLAVTLSAEGQKEKDIYEGDVVDGRIKTLTKKEEDSWGVTSCSFTYDDEGYLLKVRSTVNDEMSEICMNYTSGMLTEIRSGNGLPEGDECQTYDPEIFYRNRYPNGKINIDMNAFLYGGWFLGSGDDWSYLLWSLGLCGKASDCYIENRRNLWHFKEQEFVIFQRSVKDPDYRKHETMLGGYLSGDTCHISYEFDDYGCPVRISFVEEYFKEKIEYDLVASPTPLNPEDSPEKWMYPTHVENFTQTKADIVECTGEFVITYKE